LPYPPAMVQRRRPSGLIEPCQPSKAARPPTGKPWVHEIKHDGYRLMVRRDGSRVRCFNRRPIQFVEHLTGNGPTVFDHVCRMGLEGIVSKRVDAPYRSAHNPPNPKR
jgi:ATP-dependent DNA ligase